MDKEHRFVMVETVKPKYNPLVDELRRTIRYQLHNHLGSACIELSENAEVISYEEYHPYGTTAYQATNKTIKTIAKRYRYTGMERDEETGLECHSARYYVPWLGRWLSADPAGLIDGHNLFVYVKNNPEKFIDATGNQSMKVDINVSTKQTTKEIDHSDMLPDPTRQTCSEPIPIDVDQTSRNLADAKRAVDYVRNTIQYIGNCWANPEDERVKAMSKLDCGFAFSTNVYLRTTIKPLTGEEQMNIVNSYEAEKRMSIDLDRRISLVNNKLLEIEVEPTIQSHTGNCGEHSQLAFKFLIDKTKSRPIEIVVKPGIPLLQVNSHNYVLIGRTKGTLLDPSSWNHDTVICDPYKNQVYSIGEEGKLGEDQLGIKSTTACVPVYIPNLKLYVNPPNDKCTTH